MTCAIVLLACAATANAGWAVDFKCVEASRYKNLLQIFNDDPSGLRSYFGLGNQLPDMNSCRALIVTGTIRAGDANALLEQVMQSRGWLALLYLSFDGIYVDEEIKLAQIIRGFWLKTRVFAAGSRYEPDFVSQWGPPAAASKDAEFSPTDDELFPLNNGLRDFGRRGDRNIAGGNQCMDSCLGAWVAGINRQAIPTPPIAPGAYPRGAIPELVAGRVRAALIASLDAGKGPATSTLDTPVKVGEFSVVPPPINQVLRKKCAVELAAGEAIEVRIADAMKRAYSATLFGDYDSVRLAGIRLQRCVAGAYETERLASYQRMCGSGCDKAKLAQSFERSATSFVTDELTFAKLVGQAGTGDIGQVWQEDELDWHGTWTRRGITNVFDAIWVKSDQQVKATLEIGRLADRVSIVRTTDAGRCLYQGAVADRTARGTYTCFGVQGVFAWQATIGDVINSTALQPLSAAQESALKPTNSFKECESCPAMVVVPAGSFMMGSPESERGPIAAAYARYAAVPGFTAVPLSTEDPQHNVTVARPIAVSRFPVTFDEWDACVSDGGCNGYRPSDQGWGRGRRPVINVNWNDAKAYVAWLSHKTGKTYRLLSEAEWEYMARAGTTTPFWWGASFSTSQANYNGGYTYGGEPTGENRQKTVPVDSFSPNPWGLYQVHGNSYDWVEDCYHDSYNGAPFDGSAWTSGNCNARVVRGGAWSSAPWVLRSAFRSKFPSDFRSSNHGFRLARTLAP
jgi:formylglycine-generating enzyme required for sulfatase activity